MTGEVAPGIEEQTRRVLENIAHILEAAGSSMERVVKTTVYIADIGLWGTVNSIYAESFGAHTPARAVVPAPELHFGCLIEMEAIAETGTSPGKG